MKKTTLFFATLVALAFNFSLVSCNKDKDEDNTSLTGTWTGVEISSKTYMSGTLLDDTTITYAEGQVVMTLKEDQTFVMVNSAEPDESATGTYSTSGNKLTTTVIEDGDTVSSVSTYSISGKNMQLSNSEEFDFGGITMKSEVATKWKKQ